MGFSRDTRIEALVALARHCCVCHRYKGVKVEVHHILPIANNGTDDFDNAIPLCFDCHADVGHYNPSHPRGTKFSPEELRAQRDNWYKIVQSNNIDLADENDRFYTRYLVCKSFEAASEICSLDFSRLPAEDIFLTKNEVFNFQRRLIGSQNSKRRAHDQLSITYKDSESYQKTYPNAVKTEKGKPSFPYFEYLRRPDKEETETKLLGSNGIDGITRFLGENNVPIDELLRIVAFHPGECLASSPEEVFEYYIFRPLWFVYLAATNISLNPVKLHSLNGTLENPHDSIAYRPNHIPESDQLDCISLPQAAIPPGGTVLVPIATVLAPVSGAPWTVLSNEVRSLNNAQWQQVSHVAFHKSLTENSNLIGPAIWPIEMVGIEVGTTFTQSNHLLDFENLYTLDRNWDVGSCPHLFLRYRGRKDFVYFGEMFTCKPGVTATFKLIVPEAVEELIIAELEYETTYLDEVSVNNSIVASDIILQRDDEFRQMILPGQSVVITGRYILDHTQINRIPVELAYFKNERVANFMIQFC